MKTVLVLTDFSALAENAALYAVRFAQQIKAKLLLYNAFGTPDKIGIASQGLAWPIDYADEQKESEEALKDLRVKLTLEIKTHLPDEDFYPEIAIANDYGVLSELIETVVFKKSIGLIVMGGQHINNFSR